MKRDRRRGRGILLTAIRHVGRVGSTRSVQVRAKCRSVHQSPVRPDHCQQDRRYAHDDKP
jgi:hypothetical protein